MSSNTENQKIYVIECADGSTTSYSTEAFTKLGAAIAARDKSVDEYLLTSREFFGRQTIKRKPNPTDVVVVFQDSGEVLITMSVRALTLTV